jgi:lipoprotein-releasing system ATP-binding protein
MDNENGYLLDASGLRKNYYNGKKDTLVLQDVNIRIRNAEFVAVVGPSGAGKSTLLHILGGLDAPSSGQVTFEGRSLYQLSEDDISDVRNKRIGFVFQFYHLLSEFTVLENVYMPGLVNAKPQQYPVVRKNAVDMLKSVGLGNRMDHFPGQLSGGERQRVAIARSLINKPALLLCDEPTGNLDSKTGEGIFGILKDFNRDNGAALVLVTHNHELAKKAQHVYHLRDGSLVI